MKYANSKLWVKYEKDWRIYMKQKNQNNEKSIEEVTVIPFPPVVKQLTLHMILLLSKKYSNNAVIDDRILRKAKRIALSRYHPDKYNNLAATDEITYNRILEISK